MPPADETPNTPAPQLVTKARFNQARTALLDLNLPNMPFARADLIVHIIAKELGLTVEE